LREKENRSHAASSTSTELGQSNNANSKRKLEEFTQNNEQVNDNSNDDVKTEIDDIPPIDTKKMKTANTS